jgi:hypothetical protein
VNRFAQSTNIPGNLFSVRKKRSRNPELRAFGEWLQTLRGQMSRERVSQRLADKGIKLGQSTLGQYEKGTVWAPDVGVLLGLSRIYSVSFETLARAVHANRDEPELSLDALLDLIRHDADQPSDTSKGVPVDVPASAALARLQQQYEALLTATTQMALDLSDTLRKQGVDVAASYDDAHPREGKPSARARPRKTG